MDRATQERLVGAVILVFAVVAIVPAILTGPKAPAGPEPVADTAIRSLEIDLEPAAPPSDVILPEPVAPSPAPGASRGEGAVPAAPSGLPPAGAAQPSTRQPAAAQTPGIATPVGAAPAADPSAAWAVQLGAFSSQAAAEKLVKDLRSRGYPAFIAEYRADGRVLHRVRVGPEQDRNRADALAARLAKDGYKGNVARHP